MNISFGSIPDVVGSFSTILCVISVAIEALTVVYYIWSLFGQSYQSISNRCSSMFSVGVNARNSMYCTLILLLCIANVNKMAAARKIMSQVASVCHFYAIGSLCIFLLSILLFIVTKARSISISNVHVANNKIRNSSMLSFLICIIIDYFMSF